jgi:hypothetical protein
MFMSEDDARYYTTRDAKLDAARQRVIDAAREWRTGDPELSPACGRLLDALRALDKMEAGDE